MKLQNIQINRSQNMRQKIIIRINEQTNALGATLGHFGQWRGAINTQIARAGREKDKANMTGTTFQGGVQTVWLHQPTNFSRCIHGAGLAETARSLNHPLGWEYRLQIRTLQVPEQANHNLQALFDYRQ